MGLGVTPTDDLSENSRATPKIEQSPPTGQQTRRPLDAAIGPG